MLLLLIYYAALRYLAYAGWCYGGLYLLKSRTRLKWLLAPVLALARLLLGFISDYIIFYEAAPRFLLPSMRLTQGLLASYFMIFIPVRFIEWLILAMIIIYLAKRPLLPLSEDGETPFIRRQSVRALGWIVGGIALSCLLDVFMLGLEQNFAR